MALTYIAAAHYNSSGSTSIVINKPTGTVENDIMIATIFTFTSGHTTTQPTGWTLIGKQFAAAVYYESYYKVAGASEPSTYTWSGGTSGRMGCSIATYRGGFDTTDPVDVISSTVYDTSNSIARAASMTVSATDSPLIIMGNVYDGGGASFTKPSIPTTDWVEDYDGGAATSDHYRTFCSMTWSSSGATGDMDLTFVGGNSQYKAAFAVALNPEGGTTNTTNFFQMF